MEAAKIGPDLRLADATSADRNRKPLMKNLCLLDCEQYLFFFRFTVRGVHARASAALAPSVTRVVIYVSRAFCLTDQEKRETARSLSACWHP